MAKAFFDRMAPYAARASKGTGLDEGVILAQWSLETGNGTSDLMARANNYAGITWWGGNIGHKDPTSGYAAYNSIDQFVDDYIQVMNSSHYTDVRKAGTVSDTIRNLGASPWAESHYAYTRSEAPNESAVGVPGRILNDIYYANDLGQYAGHSASTTLTNEPVTVDANTQKLLAIGAATIALFALLK